MVEVTKKDLQNWKDEIIRQNMIMYEKYHADVKVIGEQYLSLQEKIDSQGKKIHSLFEMVAQNSVDITVINDRLSKIETDIAEIKKTLKNKADSEKIKKIEKNIVLLKQKIA